jgi:hypothetical protein
LRRRLEPFIDEIQELGCRTNKKAADLSAAQNEEVVSLVYPPKPMPMVAKGPWKPTVWA